MANRRIEMHEYQNALHRLRQGQSIRSIANDGILSRNKIRTVQRIAADRHWLCTNTPLPDLKTLEAAFSRSKLQRPGGKAQPYDQQIRQWVEEGVQAKRIHEVLVEQYGFDGSYNCIQRFVQKLKSQTNPDLTVPLKFRPGEALQIDFGKGPDLYDERVKRVVKTWVFVATLCYSRHQYCELVTYQDIETWLQAHQNAFEWFGGVPDKVIIDNPKCAITKACYNDPQVQRSYEHWAQTYGFIISACPPREPKKKGRVESGVKFVKRNFFPLRDLTTVQSANTSLKEWVLGRAGNRRHGTTFDKPLTQFLETEKAALKPLPETRPELAIWLKVSLYKDCHVRFKKNRYSAPHTCYGKPLWLKATPKVVSIYDNHILVAEHARCRQVGEFVTTQSHLPIKARVYLERDGDWCLQQAHQIGDSCTTVIEHLLTDPIRDLLHQAQGIIRLVSLYGSKRLESACHRACYFQAMNLKTIKSILEKGLDYHALSANQAFDSLGEIYTGRAQYQRSFNEFSH